MSRSNKRFGTRNANFAKVPPNKPIEMMAITWVPFSGSPGFTSVPQYSSSMVLRGAQGFQWPNPVVRNGTGSYTVTVDSTYGETLAVIPFFKWTASQNRAGLRVVVSGSTVAHASGNIDLNILSGTAAGDVLTDVDGQWNAGQGDRMGVFVVFQVRP